MNEKWAKLQEPTGKRKRKKKPTGHQQVSQHVRNKSQERGEIGRKNMEETLAPKFWIWWKTWIYISKKVKTLNGGGRTKGGPQLGYHKLLKAKDKSLEHGKRKMIPPQQRHSKVSNALLTGNNGGQMAKTTVTGKKASSSKNSI